jgi:hypothetical protein
MIKCQLFLVILQIVFSQEFLDAPGGIHQLLLTGKKRVAVGADLNANVPYR